MQGTTEAANSCIIDQDIQTAILSHLREHGPDLIGVTQIGLHREGIAAQREDVGHDLLRNLGGRSVLLHGAVESAAATAGAGHSPALRERDLYLDRTTGPGTRDLDRRPDPV